MKTFFELRRIAMVSMLAMLCSTAAIAADHGYVTGILDAQPEESLFPVNIEKINDKDAQMGPNHRAEAGENEILVSLAYNSSWGTGMSATQGQVYSKSFKLDVEKGKTYHIGAKVDTNASAEAQADGSFWSPVVVEVH